MAPERSRYGLLVSALGAIVLAVSVFLPWYGVSFTSAGIAFAQHVGSQVASQFGNATLQSYMGALHADLSSLAGHQFMALSAHQALKDLNIVLLISPASAVVLAPDRRWPVLSSSSSEANRAPLALLGAVATVCVLFRIVDPPTPAGGLLALACARALGVRCLAPWRWWWERCGRTIWMLRPVRGQVEERMV